MKLTSLPTKALLTISLLVSPLIAHAQSARSGQGDPPPAKAPTYRAFNEASAPTGWRRYEFGSVPMVSAVLPVAPKEFTEQQTLGGDKPSVMHMYTAETDAAMYGVYYAEDLPFIAERMSERIKQSFYEGMVSGFTRGLEQGMSNNGVLMKVEIGERRKVVVDGLDGMAFDFAVGPVNGMALMTILGQRAYMAIAVWTPEAPSGDRNAFFKSFRILKR